jgi:hypothetical protein
MMVTDRGTALCCGPVVALRQIRPLAGFNLRRN